MRILYSYMIEDSEGFEEFFDTIKLAPEGELMVNYEAEYGSFNIEVLDSHLIRSLTITQSKDESAQ